MSKTLAYLAGVIDSDGCITIKRRRVKTAAQWNLQACIFVRQVSREAIDVLQSTFGGRVNLRPGGTGARPLYHWEADRKRAAAVAKAILPYLRIKRQQAEIILEFSAYVADATHRKAVTYFVWEDDEPCYTVAEACALKGCEPTTIYQAISHKSIPSKRAPGAGHGIRMIPKRFWDSYAIRKGMRNLPAEYISARDQFRQRIHALNGPTRGVPTLARFA